jgi:hypothetical protein
MGISLDDLIGTVSARKVPHLSLNRQTNNMDADLLEWEAYSKLFQALENEPNVEYACTCNQLPQTLLLNYEYITRFYYFKWEQADMEKPRNYHDTILPKKLRQIHLEFVRTLKKVPSVFLLDFQVFQYMATEIKYYANVHLIQDDEVEQLKDELFQLLEHMEKICISGSFEETDRKAYFYISDINIDTNYAYLKGGDHRISMIKTFTLNTTTSTDEEAFEITRKWINAMKRISILISVSGGKRRTSFFDTQRKIIETI